jgi:hypothetical protein
MQREPRQRSAPYSAPRRGFWLHCESCRHYFRNKRVFQAVRRPDGELSANDRIIARHARHFLGIPEEEPWTRR